MARSKGWKETSIINGFVEIQVLSWPYFIDFVHKEFHDYQNYIWRGQRREDWALVSTLDRLMRKTKINKIRNPSFIHEHLSHFQYAVRGRRGPNPSRLETDNDWWALGQHYELATPLLDWTKSPFVAAYFAFIGEGEKQTESRSVYALNRTRIIRKVLEKGIMDFEKGKSGKKNVTPLPAYGGEVGQEVEFINPFSDENQRLVSQGGLFSRFPANTDVQSWVQTNFKDEKKYNILIKICIPNKDRETCLKSLNGMNINHLTLFPDLSGASKFCNLFGEIESY